MRRYGMLVGVDKDGGEITFLFSTNQESTEEDRANDRPRAVMVVPLFKAAKTTALHPNCRCKLVPLAEGPHRGYTEGEISYAERLGISDDALEELKKSASMEDLLFVDNIVYQYGKFFHDAPPVEKILSALYIVKNNDEETARNLLREAGFTETFVLWTDYGEIGHILLAYEAAKMGENLPVLDANYEK